MVNTHDLRAQGFPRFVSVPGLMLPLPDLNKQDKILAKWKYPDENPTKAITSSFDW